MRLHQLSPPRGSKRDSRRVGRGLGSGRGKTAGKGTKGQKARAGGSLPLYFEGGQLPLVRRLPYRRGFHNPFRVEYEIVNLDQLGRVDEVPEITPATMSARGLIRKGNRPVKILARGDLSKALTVHAHAFSEAARRAITAAGGSAVELPRA